MLLSTLGLLIQFSKRFLFFFLIFIYLGFCLNVEQPYMIITRTSQTLSSKLKTTKFRFILFLSNL